MVHKETKDRTLEEIDEMFEQKLPALKFKGYKCVQTTNIGLTENNMTMHNKEGMPQHVETL